MDRMFDNRSKISKIECCLRLQACYFFQSIDPLQSPIPVSLFVFQRVYVSMRMSSVCPSVIVCGSRDSRDLETRNPVRHGCLVFLTVQTFRSDCHLDQTVDVWVVRRFRLLVLAL